MNCFTLSTPSDVSLRLCCILPPWCFFHFARLLQAGKLFLPGQVSPWNSWNGLLGWKLCNVEAHPAQLDVPLITVKFRGILLTLPSKQKLGKNTWTKRWDACVRVCVCARLLTCIYCPIRMFKGEFFCGLWYFVLINRSGVNFVCSFICSLFYFLGFLPTDFSLCYAWKYTDSVTDIVLVIVCLFFQVGNHCFQSRIQYSGLGPITL